MAPQDPDTDHLLHRAGQGDPAARQQLLVRHQDRLRKMIALRMDRRLAARIDPSDVVQEAMVEAVQRLPGYLRQRPLPFYPWLRGLACERLVDLEQLSTPEIAAVLGVTEGAVYTRHLRALERLRRILGNEVAEEKP